MRKITIYNMCNSPVQIFLDGTQRISLPKFNEDLNLKKEAVVLDDLDKVEWYTENRSLECNLSITEDCRLHIYPLGIITITEDDVVQSIRGDIIT